MFFSSKFDILNFTPIKFLENIFVLKIENFLFLDIVRFAEKPRFLLHVECILPILGILLCAFNGRHSYKSSMKNFALAILIFIN